MSTLQPCELVLGVVCRVYDVQLLALRVRKRVPLTFFLARSCALDHRSGDHGVGAFWRHSWLMKENEESFLFQLCIESVNMKTLHSVFPF